VNRRINLNGHQKPLLVSALILTLGLVLSGCGKSSDGGEPRTGTSPTTQTSSNPEQAGTGGAKPVGSEGGPIVPGTYRFSFLADADVETPDALVDVPSGFVASDDGYDWYVVSPDGDTTLGLWTVGKVDRDACRDAETDATDPGPSVKNLADALVAQKSTRASEPKQVTLDGHRGLYVELASPRDISSCGKYPGLWRNPERPIYGGGQVDRVWILDVDGQRLVADASYGPTATTAERDNLTTMVDSMKLVKPTKG
jgi:hypothetical protein